LKRSHAETGRGDEFRDRGVLHTGVCYQHPEIADCTDKFQNAMIAPFIDSGAWL
jgi:hypothetical protein